MSALSSLAVGERVQAFILGLKDAIQSPGAHGRTWDDNQDNNEAYDQGVNVAYFLLRLTGSKVR
jgi:hypothetical protein